MRSALPPLDLHAHIDVTAPATQLHGLRAVIFAATRSLGESRAAVQRQDDLIIWGVGSHPGLASSHRSFDVHAFRSLIAKTPYVSEFGLDGAAQVPLETQVRTLRGVLEILADEPRIVKLHSYRATTGPRRAGVCARWPALCCTGGSAVSRRPASGRAWLLLFSVNAAMFRRPARCVTCRSTDCSLRPTIHMATHRGLNRINPATSSRSNMPSRGCMGWSRRRWRRVAWRNLDRLVRKPTALA